MMHTLRRCLNGKPIDTPREFYRADVEGDIEAVKGVLKITRIRVTYQLKVPPGKEEDARQALAVALGSCSAAQSVIGCIEILDNAVIGSQA